MPSNFSGRNPLIEEPPPSIIRGSILVFDEERIDIRFRRILTTEFVDFGPVDKGPRGNLRERIRPRPIVDV